jgi:hypothetical protein
LGPHATVFAVLEAYPFLREFLTEYDEAFRRISPSGGRPGWARVTTLGDVAVEMDVTWRRLVSDIATEVARVTGQEPPLSDPRHAVGGDDARLAALHDIATRLEGGGSLIELAAALRGVTAGVGPREAAALDRALGEAAAEARAVAPDVRSSRGSQEWKRAVAANSRPGFQPLR